MSRTTSRFRDARLGAAALALLAALGILAARVHGTAARSRPRAAQHTAIPTVTSTTIGPGCQFISAHTLSHLEPPGSTNGRSGSLEYLTDAVAQPAACFDQITFTFDRGDGPELPPGYLVEYRSAPFGLPGISSSTASFQAARYVLYVEMEPASTTNARNPTNPVQTYKGNLRLALLGARHTVIVEWIQHPPLLSGPPGVVSASPTPSSSTTALLPITNSRTTNSKSAKPTTTTAPATTSTPTTTPAAPAPDTDPLHQRVVWLIGLDSKRPFVVDSTVNPPRVIIDIMH